MRPYIYKTDFYIHHTQNSALISWIRTTTFQQGKVPTRFWGKRMNWKTQKIPSKNLHCIPPPTHTVSHVNSQLTGPVLSGLLWDRTAHWAFRTVSIFLPANELHSKGREERNQPSSRGTSYADWEAAYWMLWSERASSNSYVKIRPHKEDGFRRWGLWTLRPWRSNSHEWDWCSYKRDLPSSLAPFCHEDTMSSLRNRGKPSPSHTGTWSSSPQNCEKSSSTVYEPPVWAILLQQPKWTRTPNKWRMEEGI